MPKLEPVRSDFVRVGSCGGDGGGSGGRCVGAPRLELLDVVGREPAGLAIESALPPSAILLVIGNSTFIIMMPLKFFLKSFRVQYYRMEWPLQF